ncbi:MAG: hypothetical protein IJT98_11170 [Prevotella sp.]|nr:hypothetical protein [Prevotella sp.]
MTELLMLEEYIKPDREPSTEEFNLIRLLVEKANYSRPNWDVGLRVAEMQDGMGSLLLIPQGQLNQNRLFKDCISEITIKDYDGIDVLISLNIDQDDYLFELDVWKVNFGAVQAFRKCTNTVHSTIKHRFTYYYNSGKEYE